MSNPAQNRKVAISYAGKQEREGENHGAVERFCKSLTKRGVPILRDRQDLKLGDDIKAFMRRIGASDFLCIFLSDDYLRSPNCMYELLIAWERSRENADEFRSRVKVWIMPGTSKVNSSKTRNQWVEYWKNEYKEHKKYLKPSANSSPYTKSEIDLMKAFSVHVDEMLAFFGNTLSPCTAREFSAWIKELAPGTGKGEQNPEAVFGTVIEEIDFILGRNATVSDFLFRAIPKHLASIDGRPSLRPAIRDSGFRVVDFVEAVGRRIKEFRGAPCDFDDLQMVLSGLIVLGVDATWVVRNRLAAAAEFPAPSGRVPMADGFTANLLPVLVAALAGGLSQLERVYAEKVDQSDARHLRDLPVVLKAVRLDEQAAEISTLIAESVVPPSWSKSTGVSQEMVFAGARDIMRREALKKRNPYFGSGPGFRTHQKIIRDKLNIPSSEMLLIFQGNDIKKGSAIYADPIDCLSELREIFLTIETLRKQLP